ncbi:immunoglobulin domain-containing protein [Ohtaekwangia koreensis]|uniref:Ig-like domain-containing protein n=1 Tax=Ohtaekwangia koreensis TaxID=688867 RepID=A0A1T5K6X0_9BACT|nr:hypothetical protein [Ohtaekwangia koreensis]SKC59340.1 hypothetical protein SAMN05660236_1874 [Ohtaekwangia koreensis]
MHTLLDATGQGFLTSCDNGTFEALDSEKDITTYPQHYDWGVQSIERAPFSYQGGYSLKVKNKTDNGYHEGFIMMPVLGRSPSHVLKSTTYLVRARVYIPSEGNNGAGTNVGVEIEEIVVGTSMNGGICNNQSYHPEFGQRRAIPKDTWVEIYRYFKPSRLDNHHLRVSAWKDSEEFSELTYYIDNIEFYESNIVDNASISGFDIILNPSGSLPSSGGTGNIPYTYAWNDGSTAKDRHDLAAGTYSVTISSACGLAKTFTYTIGQPSPPCANDVEVCLGSPFTLTAGCGPSGSTYSWYDAPFDGNLLGIGDILTVSSSISIGTSYYVQLEKNGVSSQRAKVSVTVRPLPDPGIMVVNTVFKTKPVVFNATNHKDGYRYDYTFYYGEGDNQISEQISFQQGQVSYVFKDQGDFVSIGVHPVVIKVEDSYSCSSSFSFSILVKNFEPLCEAIVPIVSDNGKVKLDKFSGQYIFQRNQNCSVDIPFGCIQGQTDAPQLKNVVSASATTFSDSWKYDYLSVPPSGNALEKGEVGKWRPLATYTYSKGNVSVDKNYNSGTFQLSHFNWQYPEVTKKSGWLKVNEITKYSPNGEAVEEKNALDILSTAKFGYSGALPYLIAQNASYGSVLFESFENLYSGTNAFEDGIGLNGNSLVMTTSHSGRNSLLLTGQFISHSFTLTKQLQDKGLLVRVWTKGTDVLAAIKLKLSTLSTLENFSLVARSGQWSLLEARIEPGNFGLAVGGTFTAFLIKQQGGDVWIDDVRMQPINAEVTCYVYDVKTLRVLTVLDDQHFGLFYQYNAEGKLVRKQIETARGVKTVQETQYNIPERNKTDFNRE